MTTKNDDLEAALLAYGGGDEDEPETPQDDPATVSPVSPSQPGPTYTPPEEDPEKKADDEPKNVTLEREIEPILADPGLVKLGSGLEVRIVRMKTREFFALMRIVTNGALPALMSMQVDFDVDDDAFLQRLLSVVVMAIPNSEQQAIDFIQQMCVPVDLNTGPKMTRAQVQENVEKQQELLAQLANPEIDDLLTIIEAIIRQESEDIQGLGKRLGQMWKLAQKTGQLSSPASSGNSED